MFKIIRDRARQGFVSSVGIKAKGVRNVTVEQIKEVEETLLTVMKREVSNAVSENSWLAVVETARTLIELERLNRS